MSANLLKSTNFLRNILSDVRIVVYSVEYTAEDCGFEFSCSALDEKDCGKRLALDLKPNALNCLFEGRRN